MGEFEEKPRGVLVSMEEDTFSGYIYNVWFQYTRDYVKKVKEGGFLAIRNFESNANHTYSILEIISAVPQHYALGTSPSDTSKAFPGFVFEAAKSLKGDWEQQEPTEPTTIIRTQAIPTGFQVTFNGTIAGDPENDVSLPMIGEEAHLLTDDFTSKIVNQGLLDGAVATITPGNLVQSPAVQIHLSVEDLLRTHFGIFGFTNAGKSNLLSTLLSKLLGQETPLKLLLADIMSEYLPLLIDMLDTMEEAYIVVFGEDSVPGGDDTITYLKGTPNKEDDAINSILRTLLLPKELSNYREQYKEKIRNILKANKIRVYESGTIISSSQLRDELTELITGNLGNAKTPIKQWIDFNFSAVVDAAISQDQLKSLVTELRGYLNSRPASIPVSFGTIASTPVAGLSQFGLQSPTTQRPRTVQLSDGAIAVLEAVIRTLNNYVKSEEDTRPKTMLISLDDIIKLVSSKDKPSLIIFQSNRDDDLRQMTSRIISAVYATRRRFGIIEPLTLSVFDEADEFMPQNPAGTYQDSSRIIQTLARRGRKFGMGLSIATQRVAYLNTSTLAQPHTYFVSKMPRKYDRDAMADMFGTTEEMMTKTLKFTKGQWLLVSYDATGLVNVPMPIKFPNANDRIKEYLATQ
ncbi:ATP-binding protein [Candidatus Woesearchaeota archaeon]|nr:ATP-binding protein [Candidatus Woesearchaeota archaeon]